MSEIALIESIDQSELQKIFASHLKKALADKNMKQSKLEEETDIAQPQLSEYISGKKLPTFFNAYKIAMALDLSFDDLCGLTKAKKVRKNNDVNMLKLIANIIEDNKNTWKAEVSVVSGWDIIGVGEESGTHYSAAICATDGRFHNFILEYGKAVNAGQNAVSEYKLSADVADSMKKTVLDRYIEIFTGERSAMR